MKRLTAALLALAMIIAAAFGTCTETDAATKLTINLTKDQTFYILPGNTSVTYQVKITAGEQLGDTTFSSDNLRVATIDGAGTMVLRDAGSAKITVTSGSKSVTRTVKVLLRTDWTKTVSITGASKLTIKNQVCTLKMKNLMDFPVKMTYTYDTYSPSGNLLKSGNTSSPVYLPASKSYTCKVMMPEGVSYVTITGATFAYDQFGCASISTKKVKITESTKTDSKNKTIKYKVETIKNTNKSQVILPYHVYLYDQKGTLISVEYRTVQIASKQTVTLQELYKTKDDFADSYTAKVKFSFGTPIPYFQ